MTGILHPALQSFRAALSEMYSDRLEHIVLFGSRARGDAQPDSDFDLAVFIKDLNGASDRWAELDRLAALRVKFLSKQGATGHHTLTARSRRRTTQKSRR